MKDWFFQHMGELALVDSSAGVRECLVAAARDAGFDCIAAGEIDLRDRRRSTIHINTWPSEWLEFYTREKIHEFDPLMARLDSTARMFTWSEIPPKTRKERWLFDEARKFGWEDGLAISMPRAAELTGLISLTSQRPVPGGNWRRQVSLFFTMAYERFRWLATDSYRPNFAGLTARELQCLSLVAKGFTDAEIGAELGIASGTAHEHIERAKKRLGCRSRAQLVAVVVALGLVSP